MCHITVCDHVIEQAACLIFQDDDVSGTLHDNRVLATNPGLNDVAVEIAEMQPVLIGVEIGYDIGFVYIRGTRADIKGVASVTACHYILTGTASDMVVMCRSDDILDIFQSVALREPACRGYITVLVSCAKIDCDAGTGVGIGHGVASGTTIYEVHMAAGDCDIVSGSCHDNGTIGRRANDIIEGRPLKPFDIDRGKSVKAAFTNDLIVMGRCRPGITVNGETAGERGYVQRVISTAAVNITLAGTEIEMIATGTAVDFHVEPTTHDHMVCIIKPQDHLFKVREGDALHTVPGCCEKGLAAYPVEMPDLQLCTTKLQNVVTRAAIDGDMLCGTGDIKVDNEQIIVLGADEAFHAGCR